MRIARLAVFAVALVALTSSEAIKRNDQDRAALTYDYASSNAVIRQRRSPVPPPKKPKKKKPFKVSGKSIPKKLGVVNTITRWETYFIICASASAVMFLGNLDTAWLRFSSSVLLSVYPF